VITEILFQISKHRRYSYIVEKLEKLEIHTKFYFSNFICTTFTPWDDIRNQEQKNMILKVVFSLLLKKNVNIYPYHQRFSIFYYGAERSN
jgi:hypothetical protein